MANILLSLACVCLISECFSTELSTQPGIRLRVTNRGLQYADDVGIKVLFDRLRRENFKDISHKSGKFQYELYNIKNTQASVESSSLSTALGKGLTLQATGIQLHFSGNLRYKRKVGWFSISDTVAFILKVQEIGFSLTVRIAAKSDGRPMISTQAQDCSSQVHSVDVKFRGGYSWLYNLFSGEVESRVKDELKKLICKEAGDAINEDGAQLLATYPVFSKVSSFAKIDYSFIKDPTFSRSYMDIPLKGVFEPIGDFNASVPFVPAALPSSAGVDKMVYIWLTDYVFNTASFVYHEHGALRTVITPNDLNTKAFKTFLLKLYDKYPSRPMFVKVYTTKAPVFASSTNGTSVTVNGNAEIHVIAKNGAHIYALTLAVRAVLNGSLGVKYGNLTFHAKSLRTQVHLERSAIGNITSNIMLLQMLVDQFINSGRFVAKLNVFGDRGFPLPMLPNLIWDSSTLTTGEGFTLIKTNVKYLSRR